MTIEIVIAPRERECLVRVAWAISEKIPAWLYIIIGLVAAYLIRGIKIKTNSSHLVKQPSFAAAAATFTAKLAQKHIIFLGMSDLYEWNVP